MAQSNYVEIQIRDAKSSMTKAERAVAEYVESRLSAIPKISIKQLAQESNTSEASVMRFCKALGYDGYRDFSLNLSAALGSMDNKWEDREYTDIQPGDDLETIMKNVSFNNRRSIEDTLTALDQAMVEQAVELCYAIPTGWTGTAWALPAWSARMPSRSSSGSASAGRPLWTATASALPLPF